MNSFKLILYPAMLALLNSCAAGTADGGSLPDDTSTSGVVAAIVGGAVSASDASGTYADTQKKQSTLFSFLPSAYAANVSCPMPRTTSGTTVNYGCSASGMSYWFTRNSCSFGSSPTTWSGVQAYFLSGGTASCSAFPFPSANGSIVRQYVTASGSTTPGTMTRTLKGTVITMDDASVNLSNFNGDTLSTLATSGYGTKMNYSGTGSLASIQIAERTISPGRYDHSVVGSMSLTESSVQRTVTGTFTVYYNLEKVIGTSTLNQLIQTSACCVPVGGSITTTYAAGAVPPTAVGAKLVGKSETLTFKSCGVGNLVTADGIAKLVNTNTCL